MNAVEALDEIARIVTTTKRRRSPLEGPNELTDAYVGFILAWGYARVGRTERARELAATSRAPLNDLLHDPVHGYLVAAFDARIETAITGAPSPPEMITRLAVLSRSDRYKLDKLRAATRILCPAGRPNGPAKWFALDTLPELAPLATGDAPAIITELLNDLAAMALDRRHYMTAILIEIMVELDATVARPMARRVMHAIDGLPEPCRALGYAQTLAFAAWLGEDDLVAELFARLVPMVSRLDVTPREWNETVIEILELVIPIATRAELPAHTSELLDACSRLIGDKWRPAQLWIAGGNSVLGKVPDPEPMFVDSLERRLVLTDLLDVARAIALARPHLPADVALPRIVSLARYLFVEITDPFSTNTHACLAVLHFVDSLVAGVASHAPVS